MAQELGKVNISPKLRKMSFLHKKVFFSKFQFLAKSSFLKKSCPNSKNQTHTLVQQVLTQQIPTTFCCYYKPPRKSNIRPFKRAIVRFSGPRSCGDIDKLNFLIQFFEKWQKRPGRLGLNKELRNVSIKRFFQSVDIVYPKMRIKHFTFAN